MIWRNIEATRSARIPVTLIDQRLGKSYETQLAIRETQQFALTDNRHPQDSLAQHDPSSRLISTMQLRRWEESPPSVAVSTLIAHLQQPNHETTNVVAQGSQREYRPHKLFGASHAGAGNLAFVEPAAGNADLREMALDEISRSSGVIELAPMETMIKIGEANAQVAAFFVGREHLVAPDNAMPSTALVPLIYPDGKKVYGLIEKRDPVLGLALIFTPRPGDPLPLGKALISPGKREISLSGQPLLNGQEVAGVWISEAIRGWKFVNSSGLREFANPQSLASN